MKPEQPYIAEKSGTAWRPLRKNVDRAKVERLTGRPDHTGRPKVAPSLTEMVEVARLFYKDDLTKQQISTQLGFDPRKVTWLLEQAKELGIVQITIHDPVNGAIPVVTSHRPEPRQMFLPLKPVF